MPCSLPRLASCIAAVICALSLAGCASIQAAGPGNAGAYSTDTATVVPYYGRPYGTSFGGMFGHFW